MAVIIPIPIYRYFDKQVYARKMAEDGEMFFNTISAFPNLEEQSFADSSEGTHLFKDIYKSDFGGGLTGGGSTLRRRRISNAWAFCGTTTAISTAKKRYCVYIKNFGYLIHQIDKEVKKIFGEDLAVMFGPVTYYSEKSDLFSCVQYAPFFLKPESYKDNHEFRIVINPSSAILNKGKIEPFKLFIPNPSFVFEEMVPNFYEDLSKTNNE